MKPAGHTSVMASRADHAPDALDYFPTPPWAARAGGELIKSLDPDALICWEPACGEGHMAHGLQDYFALVETSDVFDYGVGARVVDFLDDDGPELETDWIISNPPFVYGPAFVRRACRIARRGVAMLLRLSFLEGGARHALLTEECPLAVCAPFAERVPMVKGRWDPAASSATAYAWFIWTKPWVDRDPVLRWIAPGTRERLTRPDDARLFGSKDSGPLFGSVA